MYRYMNVKFSRITNICINLLKIAITNVLCLCKPFKKIRHLGKHKGKQDTF